MAPHQLGKAQAVLAHQDERVLRHLQPLPLRIQRCPQSWSVYSQACGLANGRALMRAKDSPRRRLSGTRRARGQCKSSQQAEVVTKASPALPVSCTSLTAKSIARAFE